MYSSAPFLLEDGVPDPSVPSLPTAAAAVRQLGGGGGGGGSSLLQVGKPCTNNNTNFLFGFYYSTVQTYKLQRLFPTRIVRNSGLLGNIYIF